MYHVKRYRKLGRDSAHRRAMLRNLTTSFFIHGYVKTTLTRAKEVQPIIEKCITYTIKAHRGDLKAYRKLRSYLHPTSEPLRVYLYLTEYKGLHQGGKTSLQKLTKRRMGDGAPQAYVFMLTVNHSNDYPEDLKEISEITSLNKITEKTKTTDFISSQFPQTEIPFFGNNEESSESTDHEAASQSGQARVVDYQAADSSPEMPFIDVSSTEVEEATEASNEEGSSPSDLDVASDDSDSVHSENLEGKSEDDRGGDASSTHGNS